MLFKVGMFVLVGLVCVPAAFFLIRQLNRLEETVHSPQSLAGEFALDFHSVPLDKGREPVQMQSENLVSCYF